VLVTCATFNYLDMLCLLLASHRATNPDVPLLVHAIGWPPAHVNAAQALYPNARFLAQSEDASDGPLELKGPVPRSADILRMKVRLFHETYQSCDEQLTWVDADTLLLSPVKPLLERVRREGDFGVLYRPRSKPHARFNVAVMSFTRSEQAQRLMARYAEITRNTAGTTKRNEVAWFHDQLALWDAWRELGRGVLGLPRRNAPRLVQLSPRELSIDGNTDAVFVSRRDKVLDTDAMIAYLQEHDVAMDSVQDHVDAQS
jgi:hypothetical protein